jgi:hypothetical protein
MVAVHRGNSTRRGRTIRGRRYAKKRSCKGVKTWRREREDTRQREKWTRGKARLVEVELILPGSAMPEAAEDKNFIQPRE